MQEEEDLGMSGSSKGKNCAFVGGIFIFAAAVSLPISIFRTMQLRSALGNHRSSNCKRTKHNSGTYQNKIEQPADISIEFKEMQAEDPNQSFLGL